jgi:hypothetical protein
MHVDCQGSWGRGYLQPRVIIPWLKLLKPKGGEESAIFPAKPNIKNPLA